MNILSINGWWEALSGAEQMYWGIAIVASLIFTVQLILTFIGLDAELEAELDTGDGFGIISFKTLVAFATFFGWGGVVALAEGFSSGKALMIAFLAGFLAMVALAYVLSQLLKLQESGTVDLYDAIRKEGEVYLRIPSATEGKGKIHVEVENKLMEFDAISDGEAIPTGAKIKIKDIINENVMLVTAI